MRRFLGLCCVSLIVAAGDSAASRGQRHPGVVSDGRPLIIRIYDLAGVPSRTLDRAIKGAGEILSTANVDAIWQRGSDTDEAHAVDLSIPTVKRAAQDYRGYVVVGIFKRMPDWFHHGALGYALPFAQSGVNASIFYDRIECLDEPDRLDLSEVLGQIIAHELGHVLLGSTEHSGRGIMRAAWGKQDFQISRPGATEFTAKQRAAIMKRLAVEGTVQARN